ncbi:MAG: hypothetical protein JSW66_04340 [Phycisphaerales bacterium]|nr:MAG: hypothetical protein JSW66_04340 [Phycisphaerales bacterium]
MKTQWANTEMFRAGCMMWAAICIVSAGGLAAEPGSAEFRFTLNEEGEYVFDTGVLRGKLRQDDKTLGLSSVVHVPSGTRLDGAYGIFSYYRVFTTNKRYGHAAWEWPCISKLLPDGAVQIFWPADENRPIETSATYRIAGQSAIDLETVVKAQKDLPRFEVFLASYFRETLAIPFVYVRANPESERKGAFLRAKKSFGDWQMFPATTEALPIIRDGRWRQEPNPVQWAIMPYMAAPVGIRRSATADLAVALMAPPQDCFAVSTPYEGESHYSLYLSLFGRDLKAAETAKARSRLVVAAGASNDAVLDLYRDYVKGLPDSAVSRASPPGQAPRRERLAPSHLSPSD